jgi:hypothetical protein
MHTSDGVSTIDFPLDIMNNIVDLRIYGTALSGINFGTPGTDEYKSMTYLWAMQNNNFNNQVIDLRSMENLYKFWVEKSKITSVLMPTSVPSSLVQFNVCKNQSLVIGNNNGVLDLKDASGIIEVVIYNTNISQVELGSSGTGHPNLLYFLASSTPSLSGVINFSLAPKLQKIWLSGSNAATFVLGTNHADISEVLLVDGGYDENTLLFLVNRLDAVPNLPSIKIDVKSNTFNSTVVVGSNPPAYGNSPTL